VDKAQYWARTADQDNIFKRQAIVKRLLSLDLISKDVLEVGVGFGTAAAAINIVILGRWNYKGTDVSPDAVELFKKQTYLDAHVAEVIDLPFEDGSFDTVIALDVLEHVNPKERIQGYAEIGRVLKPFGQVVLNIPLDVSLHEEHEYGFTLQDMLALVDTCGMDLETWETYQVRLPNQVRAYVWAVGVR
jgi:SAM-dependent methyltransferase